MSYLKIIDNIECDSSYESSGEYGSWDRSYSHSIDGIEIVDEKSHYDLVREDIVTDGETLYIVVVQYSDGDSFGNSSGNIEYVDSFRTLEAARKCLKAVQDSESKYDKPSKKFEYVLDNGSLCSTQYPAWVGYFNSLEDVYIKELVVGRNSGKIR